MTTPHTTTLNSFSDAYKKLSREFKLTEKQIRLLRDLNEIYAGRTLNIGQAMCGVTLRERGLVDGPNWPDRRWWLTPEGRELVGQVNSRFRVLISEKREVK